MAYGYDRALRDRVISAVRGGSSARFAAARFEVGVATAIRWVRLWRETGSVMDPPRRRKRSALDPHMGWLVALREKEPDLRLDDIADRLFAAHGVTAHKAALSRLFRRCAISFKKNPVRE